jgi:hypothetical protein
MATMISEVYDAFRSAGVPEDKARAAAEALSEDQLATKADIARLERVTTGEIARLGQVTTGEIARLAQVTTGEIARLERVTSGEIAKQRQETASDIAKLRESTTADIAKLRESTTTVEKEIVVMKWMFGLVIVAVVVPLVKSFFG